MLRLTGMLGLLRDLLGRLRRARTLDLAAELAFWLFLSLVPLAVVAGLAAARVATERWDLLTPVLSSVPAPTRELIANQVNQVATWNESTLAPASLAIFVWLASSGVHAIFDALEAQAGVSTPWLRKRLLAVLGCVALSVGVASLALLGVGFTWLGRFGDAYLPPLLMGWFESSLVAKLIRIVTSVLIAYGLVSSLFWIGLPKQARRTRLKAPGTLLVVALWGVISVGYGRYLLIAGTGSAYLAGLAVIGVTMITLYLFSVALLIGAALNQVLYERRAAKGSGPARSSG